MQTNNSGAGEKAAYTVDQFAAATGLGRTTIYALLGENLLDSVLIGRRRLILTSDPASDLRRIAQVQDARAA